MHNDACLGLAEVLVTIDDPRQASKVEHDLVELPGVAASAVLSGADTFAVIESERQIQGKTTVERRLYISSLPADARCLSAAIRSHRSIENRLHWCMDVAFNDDQVRASTSHAAHNLALLKQLAVNLCGLIRPDARATSKSGALLQPPLMRTGRHC